MSRYLVIAHQTATSPELRERIAQLIREDPAAEFGIIVPETPVQNLFSWEDGDTAGVASRRANEARASIEALGGTVIHAGVGARQPLLAIADELRERPGYDAIVIGTLPAGISRWLRLDLVSQARRRFHLPVIHVEAKPAGPPRPRSEPADTRTTAATSSEEIAGLVTALGGNDPLERRRARLALLEFGHRGAAAVVPLLADPRESVRWEAARTLVDIHHPDAIPALVERLADPSADVRWLAAEALVAHGPESVVPVLRYLLAHAGNDDIVPGAHHVVHAFAIGEWEDILAPVAAGLEEGAKSIAWLVPTERALRILGTAPAGAAAAR